MKPNLLKSTSSKTAVLDKVQPQTEKAQKQQTPVKPQPQPATKSKTETASNQQQKQQTFKENKKSLFSAFEADKFASQEKQRFITGKQQHLPQQQSQAPETDLDESFETSQEALVSFKAKSKPKKKQWNFRFKLVTAIYIVVIGVMTGWVTTGAIRLAKAQSTLHISDIKYVQKLKDLEKLQQEQAGNENSNLIPWEHLISVQPLPLEDVTEYEKQSNWFDNIVNWFGNLFGG